MLVMCALLASHAVKNLAEALQTEAVTCTLSFAREVKMEIPDIILCLKLSRI